MRGSQGVTVTVTRAAPLFIKSFSYLSSHLHVCLRHRSGLPFSFSGLMSVARHEVYLSVSLDPFLPQSLFLVSTVMETQTPGFHGSYIVLIAAERRIEHMLRCAT